MNQRMHLRTLTACACMAAALNGIGAITTVDVASGETYALTSSNNKDNSTRIVAAGGSTITIPGGSGNYAFYPQLVVSGGVVRVEVASGSARAWCRFVSGLRSVEGGSLVMAAAPVVTVDRQKWSGIDTISPRGPVCDISDVTFDPSVATSSSHFRLRYSSIVRQLPTTCPVIVESGATVTLAGSSTDSAAPLLVDGTLSLTNFDVIASTVTCLPAGCKIKVSPGYKFIFRKGSLSKDGSTWTADAGATGRFNIELCGRGSKVWFANDGTDKNCRCESNIFGLGEIIIRPEDGTSTTRFRGFSYRASPTSQISIPVDTANEPAPSEDWKGKVSHWFDASDAETIVPLEFDLNTYFGWTGAKNEFNGHPIIIGWKDKVEGSGISLYNQRIWNNIDKTPEEWLSKEGYVLQVMPYLVEGGLNGKNYLCFGTKGASADNAKYDGSGNLISATEGRRLRFWNSTAIIGDSKASGNYTRFASLYCIMVFGSQQGGGRAIVGTDGETVTANGYLVRNDGTSNSWTPRSGYSMHVDGLTVNPNSNTPNGGWQIVAIDMTATNTVVTGLGARDYSDSDCGGQNYAEVIFFSEKPTVAERAACERYLAAKWGLEDTYVQWDNASSALGGSAGTVYLYDNANSAYDSVEEIAAEGAFSGTVNIPEGKTLLIEKPLPPTEADVPDTNRVGWFDPDFAGAAISTNEMAHTDLMWILYGRTLDGLMLAPSDRMYAGWTSSGGTFETAFTKNFCPRMETTVRGWLTTGPSRKWLVFKEMYNDGLGNMIRPKLISAGVGGGRSDFSMRQAFFVTDTTGGGGDIFCGENSDFTKGNVKPRKGNDVNSPIWSPSNTLVMTHTWLDTTEIDGRARGYNGRPEVLSFVTEAECAPSYIANYKGNNDEVIGEFIFYSQPLDDAARTKVQEYLMYKWFGDLNGKYADYSGATVIGAGTVKSPTLRNLPQFGEGFTGSVAGGSELSFAIGADGVADALAIDSPLVLDDGVTVTVNVSGRPPAGHYTLLTATSISGSATLDIVGLPVSRKAKLHLEADEIWLEVIAPGLTVVVQ